jgi:RNA polymerase sigma-70 factor (TIGR02943 family)
MPTAFATPPPAPAVPLPLQWLDLYGDYLFRYAVRRVRRPEVAEDLVQETLLAALSSSNRPAGEFAGRSDVRTWLTSILRNKINDQLRARYRRPEIDTSPADDDLFFDRRGRWKNTVCRWDGDPAVIAESVEFRGVLDSCVAKLPGRMAHLLLSRIADGVKTDTLCRELGINAENVWTMLHRARSRLRQCLTVHWFAEPSTAGKKKEKPCAAPWP